MQFPHPTFIVGQVFRLVALLAGEENKTNLQKQRGGIGSASQSPISSQGSVDPKKTFFVIYL